MDDKKFLNFSTLYRENDAIYRLNGENPITSEGEERLKYLNSLRLKICGFVKENLMRFIGIGSVIGGIYFINHYNITNQQSIVNINNSAVHDFNIQQNNTNEQK